jgi:hypothetical protein
VLIVRNYTSSQPENADAPHKNQMQIPGNVRKMPTSKSQEPDHLCIEICVKTASEISNLEGPADLPVRAYDWICQREIERWKAQQYLN